MTNRLRQRPVLRAALALALAILLVTTTGAASLPVHGEALAAGRNVADKINLKTLVVSIDNTPVYDSTQALAHTVRLKPDSTMSFNLSWDVKGEGDDFRDGDYFSIPVVRMEELRLTEPFTQKLELDAGGGKVAVAEGRFTYAGGLLAFEVVFNSNAQDYRIEGGPAGGYAEFTLSSGLTSIPMTFGDSGTVTVDVESGPSGTYPALPGFPGALPGMRKAVFSPDVSGSTVNLTTRYETIPASGERKFGLDWRMTFFDLVAHFHVAGLPGLQFFFYKQHIGKDAAVGACGSVGTVAVAVGSSDGICQLAFAGGHCIVHAVLRCWWQTGQSEAVGGQPALSVCARQFKASSVRPSAAGGSFAHLHVA